MRPPYDPHANSRTALACSHRLPPMMARAGTSRSTLLVVLATIALVCVPVVIVEWPREIARWHQAAAMEFDLQGDLAAAVTRMDRAIAWNGRDGSLLLLRARYKARIQQWPSALEDCDRARQLAPDSPLVGEQRSVLLQHLGRHAEAVAELREVLQESGNVLPPVRFQQLNNFAYTAAVGNLDLDEGLAAANEALRIVTNVAAIRDPAGVICFGRAVTAQERGDNLLALSSLSEARERAEAVWRSVAQQAELQSEIDPRRSLAIADEVEALRAHLAGILQLRIDICEQLGKQEDAARDKQRKEELTVDGNLAVVQPYDLPTAFRRVTDCAMVLDTRGYLYYRLQDFDAALGDLQLAVQAAQWALQAMPWLLDAHKHNVSDIRPRLQDQQEMRRSLAAIIYHRALVLQALGQRREAQQDQQRVRDLGYEPDDQLF